MLNLNNIKDNNTVWGFIAEPTGSEGSIDLGKLFNVKFAPNELSVYTIHSFWVDTFLVNPNGEIVPMIYEYEDDEDISYNKDEGTLGLLSLDARVSPVHYYYQLPTYRCSETLKYIKPLTLIQNVVNEFYSSIGEIQNIVDYINNTFCKGKE